MCVCVCVFLYLYNSNDSDRTNFLTVTRNSQIIYEFRLKYRNVTLIIVPQTKIFYYLFCTIFLLIIYYFAYIYRRVQRKISHC